MQTFKPFKQKYSLKERNQMVERYLPSNGRQQSKPGMFNVLEPAQNSKDLLKISQIFVIKQKLTLRQFTQIVRKRFQIGRKSNTRGGQEKDEVDLSELSEVGSRQASSLGGLTYQDLLNRGNSVGGGLRLKWDQRKRIGRLRIRKWPKRHRKRVV